MWVSLVNVLFYSFLFSSDIAGILLYAFISDLALSFRLFYDSSMLIIVAIIHSFHSSLLFHCMNMPQCSFYFSLDGHYANFSPQLQTISSYCKHANDFLGYTLAISYTSLQVLFNSSVSLAFYEPYLLPSLECCVNQPHTWILWLFWSPLGLSEVTVTDDVIQLPKQLPKV